MQAAYKKLAIIISVIATGILIIIGVMIKNNNKVYLDTVPTETSVETETALIIEAGSTIKSEESSATTETLSTSTSESNETLADDLDEDWESIWEGVNMTEEVEYTEQITEEPNWVLDEKTGQLIPKLSNSQIETPAERKALQRQLEQEQSEINSKSENPADGYTWIDEEVD